MSYTFSVIVPVYNRPEELAELLSSIANQSRLPEEVIVVEDGSTVSSEQVVGTFPGLKIIYHRQENMGQGFARNTGYRLASGDYLIVFDSDCILPRTYFEEVEGFLKDREVDAFGGPDAAHPDFSLLQKAISHTMTSFFTTGGMRGGKKRIGQYHPRSFNMGISREVFTRTRGYKIPFMGEDLEFSTRIIKDGFSSALIDKAYVFHKRRTSLTKFYKQLHYFGRARINLTRFHSDQLKLMHLFPTFFSLGLMMSIALLWIQPIGMLPLALYSVYFLAVAIEGALKFRSVSVGLLSIVTTVLQMWGYGWGLVYEFIRKARGIDPNTPYIELY